MEIKKKKPQQFIYIYAVIVVLLIWAFIRNHCCAFLSLSISNQPTQAHTRMYAYIFDVGF